MKESVIVDCVFDELKRDRAISACREVPLLGRYPDIVFTENGEVTAIEFKLRDWKRAIRQAYDHRLGADYAYVCLPPRKTVTENFKAAFKKAGVGLFFFQKDSHRNLHEVIKAPRSEETNACARQKVIEFIEQNKES